MPAAALKEENTAKPADPTRRRAGLHTVLVTEAPAGTDLGSALRWEACPPAAEEVSVQRRREDVACIVYSSGTGGRPKGCMLTHHSYLEQAASLMKLYTFAPGDCYLSILPTNHAIDFMVGFIGPFLCGATVVHLRTLRPEYIREALPRYLISYMAVVPMVLKSLQAALQQRFDALPPLRRRCLGLLIAVHRGLTRRRPRPWLARRLFPQIHAAFGGRLKALFVGGAFSEPQMLHFFNDVGIPVVNGYGLTEAGTALTLGRLRPFRPDTVGKPLPGVDIRIDQPDADGVGEVLARSPALMTGYLDDPELTAATIVGGWLHTGDSGRLDSDGHLQLVGRKRNMIVTPGGKNIYPEDVEGAFSGLCVFAADYIWPRRGLAGEQLVAVLHVDSAGERVPPDLLQELSARNNRLLDFKRVSGCVVWNRDFPRTASMKIRRDELARAIGQARSREEAVTPL
jgi:long-chain acyl-CoA synthetase